MKTAQPPSSSLELLCQPYQLNELLGGVPWLSDLTKAERTELLSQSRVACIEDDEWLFHQDTPAEWLYIVIKGLVRLVRAARDGSQATIRHVERGGTLGELSMVSNLGNYLYSAEAKRMTHVIVLPAAACRQVLDAYPACRAEFMSRLALELTDRLEDLALVTQCDAMARLVSYLLRQMPRGRVRTPYTLRLSLPKIWLADQLSMTPETLSRMLAKLRDQQMIETSRQRLTVLDEPGLRRLLAASE
ncbi:Crp/Fnr family transcriptional regulator [Halomonas llamarensis]|uniref:Crp/Fnr family transcriptional regulator n=1 Tax=Halomonas llamarensis TaxID=2945104 RepID=A0ABT0SNE6_9GAMM|nr:Crp/Fnr family transcriptional regulator [Halomonas llamarensis]MCL7929310.1 Crp/Fnr family transcriptional regulator [Halomonas llamarensis]